MLAPMMNHSQLQCLPLSTQSESASVSSVGGACQQQPQQCTRKRTVRISSTRKASGILNSTSKVTLKQQGGPILGDITGRVVNRSTSTSQRRQQRTKPNSAPQAQSTHSTHSTHNQLLTGDAYTNTHTSYRVCGVASPTAQDFVERGTARRDDWLARCEVDTRYAITDEFLEDKHPEITDKMRCVLLHWLGLVCVEHELQTRTYQTACMNVDRFLSESRTPVLKEHFQLLGATALMMASKVHESYPIEVSRLAALTCGACFADEIVLMETHMCQVLRWQLTPMTTCEWLSFYLSLLPNRNFQEDVTLDEFSLHQTLAEPDGVLTTNEQKEYYKKALEILNVVTLLPNGKAVSARVLAFAALSWVLPQTTTTQLQERIRTEFLAEEAEYFVSPELHEYLHKIVYSDRISLQAQMDITSCDANKLGRISIHSCSFSAENSDILDIYEDLHGE
ncbi:hypothetical protein SARC_11916 [Sphaeroforma arctica JP610]|uniref:Cyclin-like domain-containing protein n=1 Tax=Sphaeroforma arctica JP610 TaxID=667725 RepID=A0A0L0FHT4_9EUKA|nr:hypothetical protein SARC_11916 [Sphaeroforma arctica JP610]KNC75563.1 hypothetical protein SARC_11916 [Sphaeroforma arctica JP610]|eukprot:XP_014149465.1 hypothetical protein SARC_11916 [Sphaeroforma arctica JP610]